MSDPTSEAPRTGAVPLFFWLIIMVLMGLAIGMWAPWRDRSDRPSQRPVPELVAEMASADARARTEAYVRLRDWGADAGPELLTAAKDPSYGARREAIELLGRGAFEPARAFLLELRDPALREERLGALGRLGGPEALAALRGALASGDVPLEFAALRALAGFKDVPAAALDEVMPFLEDPEWGLRDQAAACLGRQRHAAAVTPLITRLQDDQPDVRNRAAWALMQIGAEEGVKAVQAALERGAVAFDPEQR
ncbi:MAG: HEAT repeat domain-containing protein [Planctomycetota bacterium]